MKNTILDKTVAKYRFSRVGEYNEVTHGLGGFFRRLVLPFIRTHGTRMRANAFKTGIEVADDVFKGRSLKESAKKRVLEGLKRTVLDLSRQSGSGIRNKRRRRSSDIFA